MSIELASRLILAGNTAVHDLVAERITFGLAAESERRPRVVLSFYEKTHYQTLTGDAGYITGRIQADCLAPSYQTAKQLTQAVITALNGYTGTVEGVPNLTIAYITADSENDIPIVVPEGAAFPSTYGVSVSFNFMTIK